MKKVLNSFFCVLISIVAFGLFFSCDDDKNSGLDPNKPKISLNKTSLTLEIGSSERLEASFEPEDTENKAHTWKSSDSKIASVDETGMVKAVGIGNCTITTRALDGGSTDKCEVTVVEKIVKVTGISLNKTTANVVEGDTIHLIPSIRPTNATDQTVIWTTSDENYATVDDQGVVTGIKEGSATITATTNDGNKKATCKLTIDYNGVKVTSISLNKTSAEVIEGDTIHLIPIIKPNNATNKNVSWKSNNEGYATVDDNGVVTAKNEGSTTITATTEQGEKTATCKVTVKFRGVRFSDLKAFDITGTSANISGKIEISGVKVKEKGLLYKSENENTETKITYEGNQEKISLTNLKNKTRYNVRLFADVDGERLYSDYITFETLAQLKTYFKPTDIYIDAISLQSPACEGYGDIKICYGKNPSPKVTDNLGVAKKQGDKFMLTLNGLTDGTKYYIRSYQEIGNKIVYTDDEISCETIDLVDINDKTSNCEMSYGLAESGQISNPYGMSYDICVVDYLIFITYNIKNEGLYKVSLSNCYTYNGENFNLPTPGYVEQGFGGFTYVRKFQIYYTTATDPGNFYASRYPANTNAWVTFENAETGVKYHCITTGLKYNLHMRGHNWSGNNCTWSGVFEFD